MGGGARIRRWRDYVLLEGGSLSSYWTSRLMTEERDLLLILGKGFDPRACLFAENLMGFGGKGKRDCLVLELDEGPSSPSIEYQETADVNWTRVLQLFEGQGTVELRTVKMWDEKQRRIGSRISGALFGNLEPLLAYTDVIIDVSAIPRDIYFPLVGNIMTLVDAAGTIDGPFRRLNIHIVVAANPSLDRRIVEEGIDAEASMIYGFGGGVDREATQNIPRVWIPILGKNQRPQLQRIREYVKPVETCPALPSPSKDPRRGDNLVRDYHDLLFDDFQVDPRNFVYVSERNPFEVYRQIVNVTDHYQQALRPLGGCKVVVSASSSKLLSLGALLVAYELRTDVGVAHVGSQGFGMLPEGSGGTAERAELFGLWLEGECYET
ncbi:MAG: hypothetical protein M3Q03_04055 [Chloroflexota bacterium]|nr:hypothetical protein [Chloroflexota bacterium]